MPIPFIPSPPFHPDDLGVFPTVIVEAAFVPAPPATGANDLILGDLTRGLLGVDVLGADDVWTDISQWVQSGSITRQSTRQQGPLVTYQGGTATFVLSNADGRFDPGNPTGPYVQGGITQVRPMIPVRVRAIWDGTTYYLFSGFATSWTPPAQNFGPVYDETTLNCGDAFRVFAGVAIPAAGTPVGAGEDTGARISRILAAAGWYSAARNKTAIDTGDSTLQATPYGDFALNLMQLATDSEAGELYIDGQGQVVFRHRRAIISDTRSTAAQGVFGGQPGTVHAAGTEYECTLLTRPDDDTTMFNDVQATIAGSSNMQEALNTASISTFLFARTYQRSDLILQTDGDALNWANWVLSIGTDDEFRFDEVTITPGVDPGDLWPQALGRELGDRVEVWKRPPNVPAYSKDLIVRGVQHDFTPMWWQTKWTTQTAQKLAFFTLGDPTLGVLGSNALVW